MAVMRAYRNIIYSLLDFITAQLTADSWTGVRADAAYKAVEDGALPAIVVSILDSLPRKKEVGSRTNIETPTIIVRIFAKNDGQRMDLAKWLVDKLNSSDIVFYTYTIVNGTITAKVANGYLRILRYNDNSKELDGVEDLEVEDKFRHKISFDVRAKGVSE